MEKKLNLGCGKNIMKGYVNLDIIEFEGTDIIHDIINEFPYPFKDDTFDEILCIGVFGLIKDLPNFVKIMNEIYRIAKPNSKIIIKNCQYWHSSLICHSTFTYNIDSFDYFFRDGCPFNWGYNNKARFKVISIKLVPTGFGKFIPPIPINYKNIKDLRHLISYFVGEIISKIHFELRVLK